MGRQKRMYECYYSVCALHQGHLLGQVLRRWHHHTKVKATATRFAEAMTRRGHKRLLRKVSQSVSVSAPFIFGPSMKQDQFQWNPRGVLDKNAIANTNA